MNIWFVVFIFLLIPLSVSYKPPSIKCSLTLATQLDVLYSRTPKIQFKHLTTIFSSDSNQEEEKQEEEFVVRLKITVTVRLKSRYNSQHQYSVCLTPLVSLSLYFSVLSSGCPSSFFRQRAEPWWSSQKTGEQGQVNLVTWATRIILFCSVQTKVSCLNVSKIGLLRIIYIQCTLRYDLQYMCACVCALGIRYEQDWRSYREFYQVETLSCTKALSGWESLLSVYLCFPIHIFVPKKNPKHFCFALWQASEQIYYASGDGEWWYKEKKFHIKIAF